MVKLERKKITTIRRQLGISNEFYFHQDVKKAVLEFEKELNNNLMYLMQDKSICMDAHNLNEIIEKFKEIFGDFK